MSRPMALGLVLLVLILTSQSDWKQDMKTESEDRTSTITKQEVALTNLEALRKEVILMQEKEIHDLKLQVQSLQEQLKNCKSGVPSNSPSRLTSLEQESDTRVTRRGELEESAPHKSTKLRGSVRTARNDKLSERPSELLAVDAFEMADDDEEKLGDR
ncbi:uncharacterized protein [Physcomitrium patens]|uniref:Uncharacterized protein n=1 Tax=Physcomitrium patens TaxID=3218 RepID=A9TLG5_PHYPA|nr:uncharacterized protein LOC112292005 [Physcomitrium patens]XP_024395833.1 uncharacterized protein LOC112292005 [Physcomitrium patens]XP_024395834.1 uncharacterized protein LOC112292005 [Physcomitrium patens]XP_024395835.1 uncharacterized protein LOC112292005 [Physcomitrium patens]PNR39385.1 hypothetical protein PHYPA_019663 [Physcomitrium patens]|eukprot:XP_024395832.1 uncharacterized protein LOC112292005 [Physcomitrella patens]